MEKKKVYIAGKVTGEDFEKTFRKFEIIQEMLEELKFEVINPMLIVPHPCKWEKAMEILKPHLLKADYLLLMPDWEISNGSKVEKELALQHGIKVVHYADLKELEWAS